MDSDIKYKPAVFTANIHKKIKMKKNQKIVTLQSIFESPQWQNSSAKLPLAIGKDEKGELIIADLARMPHLLIGGMTGSGKSVCVDSIILGLLSKFSPDDLHFVLADLKVVEIHHYQDIPHLQFPIANSCEETLTALQWCVAEIDRRYQVMETRQYNDAGHFKLPYIVFILNELSDLMLNESVMAEAAENAISSICTKGHAVGIHLIISTSRVVGRALPSGIRANIPARITFKLYSEENSCLILGRPGAEKLKGCGDMLMQLPSEEKLLRCQGAYADYEMIKEFIDTLVPCKQQKNSPLDPLDLPVEDIDVLDDEIKNFFFPGDTYRFLEAVKFVISTGKTGTRHLQEHLHIGYNRAAEYKDLLRERGVVQK